MSDDQPFHKATPRSSHEDVGSSTCVVCGQRVKRVPGGQGPTWIHEESGAVAALTPVPDKPIGPVGLRDRDQEEAAAFTPVPDHREQDKPLIIASGIHELDRLGGLMTHETTEIRYHLTFTDLVPLREVMHRISGDHSLTDEERTFLAVPARWSLYVSEAALAMLAAAEPRAYRIEGR